MTVKKTISLNVKEKEILTKARVILDNIWEEVEVDEDEDELLNALLSLFDEVNDTYDLGLDY